MDYTKYFTEDEYEQLLEHGTDYSEDKDYPPVVKLFMTNTSCTWLISELDPENPDIAFGLCDLGMGSPELGYISIEELEDAQEKFRYLERDNSFEGHYPLSVYAGAAREAGVVTTSESALKRAVAKLAP